MTPREEHEQHRARHRAIAEQKEAIAGRFSIANLILFGAFVVLTGSGAWNARMTASNSDYFMVGAGVLSLVLLIVSYVQHGRVLRARDASLMRAKIHELHLQRIEGKLEGLDGGDGLAPIDHPYAGDLDVVGPSSLFARLSVAHTEAGRRILASWLLAPATESEIEARAESVKELAPNVAYRADLEGAVLDTGEAVLDGARFLEFVRAEPVVLKTPWMRWAAVILPLITITLVVLSGWLIPKYMWVPTFVLQWLLAARAEPAVRHAHSLVVSRLRFVESYRALFEVVEKSTPKSPRLIALKAMLNVDGSTATKELRSLEMWAGFFELRSQGLAHFILNPLLLWDLNVLRNVEQWGQRAGKHCESWFNAVGEIEALSSLATLAHQDRDATTPRIGAPGSAFIAEGLRHPLIAPGARIPNDVRIDGPSQALLITGSNMAGKSTLLRAVGLNTVLALAGGVVTANAFSVPRVRLRASMRVADSLQRGASYFQAELARLRIVVTDAESEPPLLVLLDELLRGTNAKARHVGARAVLLHLLARHAMGLVATHDIALSELEDELAHDPSGMRVKNVHFTDVFENGEMKFDYILRDGVVRTSNALRLLRMAGIEVDDDTSLT
jgi:hypothetical protein